MKAIIGLLICLLFMIIMLTLAKMAAISDRKLGEIQKKFVEKAGGLNGK